MAEERKLDAAAKAQKRHRIYVTQRLPILKQELTELRTERTKLMESVKSADDKKKAELRKRQTYVVARLAILRDEQKTIKDERQKLKGARGNKSAAED